MMQNPDICAVEMKHRISKRIRNNRKLMVMTICISSNLF
jgi:hypothetical protein